MTTLNESLFANLGVDVKQAKRVIKNKYGHRVDFINKAKNLLRYGRNTSVGTSQTTVMTLVGSELHETYISDNLIDTISSSNALDTQDVVIDGHTIDSDGNFTFISQNATLNGQNKVVLTTPLARCEEIYNNSGTDLQGVVYVYQEQSITAGVPQTDNKVHCVIRQGHNQSEKCSFTTASDEYCLITNFTAAVVEKNSAYGDFELQIKEKGKVFREIDLVVTSSQGSYVQNLVPCDIIPPNSDVRMVVTADNASTDIGATIRGYYARILS